MDRAGVNGWRAGSRAIARRKRRARGRSRCSRSGRLAASRVTGLSVGRLLPVGVGPIGAHGDAARGAAMSDLAEESGRCDDCGGDGAQVVALGGRLHLLCSWCLAARLDAQGAE